MNDLEIGLLTQLQSWYVAQCNGDWEHTCGISIETVDNPGWYSLMLSNDSSKIFRVGGKRSPDERSDIRVFWFAADPAYHCVHAGYLLRMPVSRR
jgi:Immunity protein 53